MMAVVVATVRIKNMSTDDNCKRALQGAVILPDAMPPDVLSRYQVARQELSTLWETVKNGEIARGLATTEAEKEAESFVHVVAKRRAYYPECHPEVA